MNYLYHKKSRGVILRFLLLFFIVENYGLLNAQGGFRKRYYLQNSLSSACSNVIETPSNNLIAIGITVDTANNTNFNKLTLIGTDSQGNMQWRKNYGASNFIYYNNIESSYVDTSGFYQAIPINNGGPRINSAFVKFNFQGDTLWQRIFCDNNLLDDLIFTSISKSIDGGFLFTGLFQKSGLNFYNKLLLLKTDCNGIELWRKKISSNAQNWTNVLCGYSLVQDIYTKRILICGYQYIGGSISYGTVVCTDSLGNNIWQKPFMNKGSDPLNRLICLTGGKFMAVGATCANIDNWGDCNGKKSAVVKFDTDGNVIWNNVYDSEGYSDRFAFLRELPNKNILLVGIVDTSSLHNKYSGVSVRLMEIDTDGVMVKSRIIGNANVYSLDSNEIPQSIFPCKDKGFVLATRFPYAASPQPYGIIKIDSTYCDTSEQYCREVEVGIAETTNKTKIFSLSPNPANDFVFIQIASAAQNAYQLRLCDISGRELLRQNFESAYEHKLNLSEYNDGIYILSVYDGSSCIGQKKLVVQK